MFIVLRKDNFSPNYTTVEMEGMDGIFGVKENAKKFKEKYEDYDYILEIFELNRLEEKNEN